MDSNKALEEELRKFESSNNDYQKLQLIHNIIELKKLSLNPNVLQSIFIDCRTFLKLSITSIDEPNFGYYNLNSRSVNKVVSCVSVEEQLSLLRFFLRELKQNGFEENLDWVKKMIKQRELKVYSKNISFTNIVKYFAVLSTYNFLTIILSLLLLFSTYCLILLPAPFQSFECFNSEFKTFSTNTILNHFANSFLSFSSIDDDIKVKPVNIKGVLLLIFFKLLLIIFILNYLLEELKAKLRF